MNFDMLVQAEMIQEFFENLLRGSQVTSRTVTSCGRVPFYIISSTHTCTHTHTHTYTHTYTHTHAHTHTHTHNLTLSLSFSDNAKLFFRQMVYRQGTVVN